MENKRKYTTLLWDLDNTLLDFDYSEREAILRCFQAEGLPVDDAVVGLYSKINDGYWKQLELGKVTREYLVSARFRDLFDQLSITGVDVERFRLRYEEELGNVYQYIEDSLNLCKNLKAEGFQQYIITNGTPSVQYHKLKLSGLDQVMDGIFVSEELGDSKPAPAFFEACLDRIKEKDPGKILVIGDSLTSDIKGGIQAGLPTCWYKRQAACNRTSWQPDYEIECLHDICKILEEK